MQNKIVDTKHHKIGKIAAFNFIRRTYGFQNFYANATGSQFTNALLFYTLFFGVSDHLSQFYSEVPYRYVINPLLASLAAGVPTFIISRFILTYESIQNTRVAIALGRGKKILPPARMSVLYKTIKMGGGLLNIPLS